MDWLTLLAYYKVVSKLHGQWAWPAKVLHNKLPWYVVPALARFGAAHKFTESLDCCPRATPPLPDRQLFSIQPEMLSLLWRHVRGLHLEQVMPIVVLLLSTRQPQAIEVVASGIQPFGAWTS